MKPGTTTESPTRDDRLPVGIFVVDRDRRVVVFTEPCEALTACARSRALTGDADCGELLGCASSRTGACPAENLFSGASDRAEPHVRREWSERAHRWLEVTYTPLRGPTGSVDYVIGIVRDVSEGRRREPELLRRSDHLGEELAARRREMRERFGWDDMITVSPLMEAVFRQIRAAAINTGSVLIYGESGTGKELVARAIHDHGPRRDRSFVAVNCAALPGALIESELFGHVKGSFTDASKDSPGLFRAATGGTLFLDEVAEMPVGTQAKLLRALEEGSIRPVGGTKEIPVSVRVVAATNRELERAIVEKILRPDLYYRLSVIPIHLPPLRRRKEDIPLLAQHFIEKGSRGGPAPGLSDEVLAALSGYSWPGNVRELENAIARAAAMATDDTLRVDDLPARITASWRRSEIVVPLLEGGVAPLRTTLRQVEKQLIERALLLAGGNKSRAATLLGVQRKHLYRKIEEYGIRVGAAPT